MQAAKQARVSRPAGPAPSSPVPTCSQQGEGVSAPGVAAGRWLLPALAAGAGFSLEGHGLLQVSWPVCSCFSLVDF